MNDKHTKRFWSKIPRRETNQCWEWTGSKNRKGYGYITIAKRHFAAHRLAWELTIGAIPPGLCCCHHCDNPGCVNPAHLFLGTHDDNMADCKAKNRQTQGSRNPASKLLESDVLEIRTLLKRGLTQREVATRYNVKRQTIGDISTGTGWGWLKVAR